MKVNVSVLFFALFLTSCIGTKYLKKGEYILYKQKVEYNKDFEKDAISSQLVQSPNTRFLGLPITHLVYFYNRGKQNHDTAELIRKRSKIIETYNRKITKARSSQRKANLNTKKQRKVEKIDEKLNVGNQFMKWGEPLAVFDSAKMTASQTNLKNYLFSKGYFNNEVNTTLQIKKRKVKVKFSLIENNPYTIDSLLFSIQDEGVRKLFFSHEDENQLKGSLYDQEMLTKERDRVYDLMTNNGYYDFKRQYILFEVDSTTLDNKRLVVRESIANPPDRSHHKVYKVDSIIFTTESGVNVVRDQEPVLHKDVTYNFSTTKYSEKLLDWRVFIHKDSIYSKKWTLETQRQLSYLDIFKFVNINYDSSGGKFIANIFTSPLKKFQTSSEIGLSLLNQANGLPGPFINFNAKSRNIFGGLEIIQFDGNAGIQGISNVTDQETTYSRLQYGGQFSTTFPQFLFPLKEVYREKIGQYNPRTKIASGVNFEERRGEYERITFNGNFSYIWQIQNSSQLTLKPFDVSYINADPAKFSDLFQRRLDSLEDAGARSLVSAFQSAFVSFSSFSLDLNINGYGLGNVTASYFKTILEAGVNAQEKLGKYLKSNFDYRKTNRISSKSSLAYRANIGIAYVYGDNLALPYEKYFFAGGSNSIRAWNPRRLGPGSFAIYKKGLDTDGNPVIDYSFERPGDIILETSIEFRRDLIGFIEYALFIDAGNIWLWRSNTVNTGEDGFGGTEIASDNGDFRFNSFFREIAVGGGFGLRFDFSFLILRTDFAYKIVDPGYPLGERFILDNYIFSDLWNRNKVALNIGIGYPF